MRSTREGRSVTATAPNPQSDGGDTTGLRGLPVFIRAGAVVPSQAVLSYVGQRRLDTLELNMYPGSASSELYEDAGDGYGYLRGELRITSFTTSTAPNLAVAIAQRGPYAGAAVFNVTVHDVAQPRRALVDGRSIRTVYDAAARQLHFLIPSTTRRIEIE